MPLVFVDAVSNGYKWTTHFQVDILALFMGMM